MMMLMIKIIFELLLVMMMMRIMMMMMAMAMSVQKAGVANGTICQSLHKNSRSRMRRLFFGLKTKRICESFLS